MNLKDFFKCATAIIFCEAVGAIGSVFTSPAVPIWYATLARPVAAPPNWVFGPVWTTLFALMGIALYVVWEAPATRARRTALILFAVQFALNVLWSALFFGYKDITLALIEIIALWATILATSITFFRVSRTSAALLLPYFLWVTFAMYLNYGYWILN